MSSATITINNQFGLPVSVIAQQPGLCASEQLQQDHYDEIAVEYEAHYSDPCSLEYRVGGLHHIHPNVNAAMREIHRVLKPGGYFCFMEPHSGSFPDVIRRTWYKHDRFFSDNEAAIDVESMEREFAAEFKFDRVHYLGNIAFLFVLNSLIFRIPLGAKRFYSSFLMSVEVLINKLQGKLTSCFVVARWQKK